MSIVVRCQNCLYKQDIKDNQEITCLGNKYYYKTINYFITILITKI